METQTPKPRVLLVGVMKRWFDLLRSGYKKEEYRTISEYWIKRLLTCDYPFEEPGTEEVHIKNFIHDIRAGHPWEDVLKAYQYTPKTFDVVRVRNGYGGKVPQLDIKFDRLTIGKPQPGLAPKESLNELFFIIHLDDIASAANLKAA